MASSIMARINAYDQTTHDTVAEIIEAEDQLMRGYMTGVLTRQEYQQARDWLDLGTALDRPAADARATARRTVAFCEERRAAKEQLEATS